MGIEMTTSTQEIARYLDYASKKIYEAIFKTLSYLGEQCVKRIRLRKDNWQDQTGNLRSSIGYAVMEQGKVKLQSAFEQVLQGTEGTKAGKDAIDALVKTYASTYALVVVAGMDYAEYVEKMKNKDVLEQTKTWATGIIDKYMDEAIKTAIKSL